MGSVDSEQDRRRRFTQLKRIVANVSNIFVFPDRGIVSEDCVQPHVVLQPQPKSRKGKITREELYDRPKIGQIIKKSSTDFFGFLNDKSLSNLKVPIEESACSKQIKSKMVNKSGRYYSSLYGEADPKRTALDEYEFDSMVMMLKSRRQGIRVGTMGGTASLSRAERLDRFKTAKTFLETQTTLLDGPKFRSSA